MKKFFKILGLISTILLSTTVLPSCPPGTPSNYSTSTATFEGVIFTVCYPSVVNPNINGGNFNIYISMENTNNATTADVVFRGFAPATTSGLFDLNSITATSNPQNQYSQLDLTTTSSGGGAGDFVYNNGIVAGGIAQATIAAKAINGPGTYTYTPLAAAPSGGNLPSITIRVETTCPTINASNSSGATACSVNGGTGNLTPLVSGGSGPYTFSTTGAVNGTVAVSASGIYTFSPNVAGPTIGSFDYIAADIAGCTSNVGLVSLPIVPSPVAGNDVVLTGSELNSIVGPLNFSGGTAPFTYTILTQNNISTVQFDTPSAGQVTITPAALGAGLLTYSVTDANGCVMSTPANIYTYSCSTGNAVSALTVGGTVYTICYPSTVYLNIPFTITASVSNPSATTARTALPFADMVPAALAGYDPGLSYVSSTFAGAGTFNANYPTLLGQGGMGELITTGNLIAADSTLVATITVLPTALGAQNYTSAVITNPTTSLPTVFINVTTCPTITAGNAVFTGCTGAFTNNLAPLVTGGSGPYTFTGAGAATCTDVTIGATGIFTFTANPPGSTTPCYFQYIATDSNGCTSGLGTVTAVGNQGPFANGQSILVCENTPYNGTLTASGGVAPYTFAIVTNGGFGTAVITDATTGAFTYTPDPDVNGFDSFTFQATDSGGCVSNVATVNVTINQSPITTPFIGSGCVGGTITGDLSTVVTDPNLPFLFGPTGASPVGGIVTIPTNGVFTFTGNPGFSGVASFEYQVTDASGCVGTGVVDLTIASPIAGNTSANGCVNGNISGNVAGLVSGGFPAYTFGPTGAPVGGTVSVNPSGVYSFTASPGFSGAGSFQYQVTDSLGCIATGSVDVTVSSPIVSSTSVRDCQNASVTGDVAGLVTAGFPPYTFGPVTSASGGVATINPSGVFNFTATTGVTGLGGFQYLVTDSNLCTGAGTVDITIGIPVALNTGIRDCVNGSVSGNLAPLVGGGFPPYTFSATGAPVGGSVTINPSGVYNFTAATGFSGVGNFVYQATDSNSCIATGDVTVTVSSPIVSSTAVNDCVNGGVSGNVSPLVASGFPPYTFGPITSASGGSASINPSGIYNFTAASGITGIGGFNYLVTDSNACTAVGTVSVDIGSPVAGNTAVNDCVNGNVTGDVAGLVLGGFPAYTFGPTGSVVGGTVTINSAGIYSFTASPGFSGAGSFQYQVTDSVGCVASGNVDVTISSPIVSSTSVRDCQNASVTGDVAGLVTAGFPPYTFGPVTSASGGVATINPSGVFNFTATTGVTGLGGFQYLVTDSNLCTGAGTVDITIGIPVALNTGIRDCVNGSVSGNLAPLVSSGFPPYTFSATGAPVGGSVTINPAGVYNFTAATGFSGIGNFLYQATDANSCIATGDVTVTVSSPIAGNTSVIDCVGGDVTGDVAGLVTSGFTPYTFSATGSPLGGTVTVLPNGIFTFTGNPGFSGLGDFMYQVTDSLGCISTGLVDLLLSSPIAQNLITPTICANGSSTGNVSSLVTSGFPPYTFGSTGAPVGGSVTVNPSGLFNYTAASGFMGTGSFVYQATDSNNCIGTGLVSVPVISPIASNTSISTCNDTLVSSLVPLVSGGVGSYLFTGPIGGISCTGGNVTISSTGLYSFTAPNTGFTGPCSFVYGVSDSNACPASGTVTIRPNTAPVANSILLITPFETPLNDTLANSVTGGVAPLTFTQVGAAVNGTVVLNPDGSFIFTPNAGFLGTASFQYRVADSSTPACISNIATVTIQVENSCPACVTGGFACVMYTLIP